MDYASKSVAGRSAATPLWRPWSWVWGSWVSWLTANPSGIVLAVEGPAQLIKWTAKAGEENAAQAQRVREACEDGGGPETVAAARAVRDLGGIRRGERNSGDAPGSTVMPRDPRPGGCRANPRMLPTRREAGGPRGRATPTSPEAGQLFQRALRIHEHAASLAADAIPTEDPAAGESTPTAPALPLEARPDGTSAVDGDVLALDEPESDLEAHIRPALLAGE